MSSHFAGHCQATSHARQQIDGHHNYVTAAGLQQLKQRVQALETRYDHALRAADATPQEVAELEQQLHYYQLRLLTAEMVSPAVSRDRVEIGSTVAWTTPDGREHEAQIVGEDEADPLSNKLSWSSPLGRALLGAAPGEEVRWQEGDHAVIIEILEIMPEPH